MSKETQAMSSDAETPSSLDVFGGLTAHLVGLGLIVMTAFPLALPIIALTVVVAIPFVVVGLATGLLFAVLAVPVLLARRVWRTVRPRPRGAV
jgi:hypothetical protein